MILPPMVSMKNVILWNYSRGTWQYDVFCLMIVAFIFITPKTWFKKSEKTATQTTHLVVQVQDFSCGNKPTENKRP